MHHASVRWLSFTLSVPAERLKYVAENTGSFYRPFFHRDKPRKRLNGRLAPRRKERLVDNPNDEMKSIQDLIADRILAPLPVSDIAYGGVKERSSLLNAWQHVRQPSSASVDVRNCYRSVTNRMVFDFFRTRLEFGPKVADILTALTTRGGSLATGAPTSAALLNLILLPVDEQLRLLAESLGLTVTRFVDNIDFSGRRSKEAIGPTIKILQGAGLAVRHKKVFNAGSDRAHVVTGLNVNGKKPNLSPGFRGRVRAACHQLILNHRSGKPIDRPLKSIRGRLVHMRQTNPEAADRLASRLKAAGIPL